MKKTSKKELRDKVEGALNGVLLSLKILKPSKKTLGVIKKVSKKYSEQVRVEIKKAEKKGSTKQKRSGKRKPASVKLKNP